MSECPWCEGEIDVREIYETEEIDEKGKFTCPLCGMKIEIVRRLVYEYDVE